VADDWTEWLVTWPTPPRARSKSHQRGFRTRDDAIRFIYDFPPLDNPKLLRLAESGELVEQEIPPESCDVEDDALAPDPGLPAGRTATAGTELTNGE
jgi:hypothetical protein